MHSVRGESAVCVDLAPHPASRFSLSSRRIGFGTSWKFALALVLMLAPAKGAALGAGTPNAPPDESAVSSVSVATPVATPEASVRTSVEDRRSPAEFSLSSGNGPIDISSDSLSLDYKGKSVVFRGHVRAVQSGTQLTSDTLQIVYGKDFNDIRQVIADGQVKLVQGGRWATSDHAVLDQVARTVEMTPNPVIHDGPDQITGTKIVLYLDSQKSVVEGAKAVIFPHKQETRDNIPMTDHDTGRKD
jgi:lipopolysaccharide export system protein LptA